MSCDGQTFVMEEVAAIQSQTLCYLIEDNCATDIIPVPNVTGETLSLVIKYCNKHAKRATTTCENEHKMFVENLKTWDAEFMNVDQRIIYNLLMVSFLLIFILFDHHSVKICVMILPQLLICVCYLIFRQQIF